MPAASNRMSATFPGTSRNSTKMMMEMPNSVTSISSEASCHVGGHCRRPSPEHAGYLSSHTSS